MKTFWVGLEYRGAGGTWRSHGEDYREYVFVEEGEDEPAKLHAATDLTNLCDGCRIAIHLQPRKVVV